MDFFQGLLLISSIHLLAAASPGPDFVLVSQQTMSSGKKAGLLTSFGIALGLSIHIIYSSLGLAVVISQSEWLLWAIKILGAAYLVFLGVQGLRSKPRAIATSSLESAQVEQIPSSKSIVFKGFLCNALNPKAPIYFVALFTLVLSPELPLWQLSVYGVWMMVLQFLWFATVVFLLSRPMLNKQFQNKAYWIDRILGVTLVAMGIKVALTKLS